MSDVARTRSTCTWATGITSWDDLRLHAGHWHGVRAARGAGFEVVLAGGRAIAVTLRGGTDVELAVRLGAPALDPGALELMAAEAVVEGGEVVVRARLPLVLMTLAFFDLVVEELAGAVARHAGPRAPAEAADAAAA